MCSMGLSTSSRESNLKLGLEIAEMKAAMSERTGQS
jgi:hypothetical protein